MTRQRPEPITQTLPELADGGPETCPATRDEVLRHVRSHLSGAARLDAEQLEFVRTAQAEARRYWVWRFPLRGAAGYALVMEDEEGTWLSAQAAPRARGVDHVLEADLLTWLDEPVEQGAATA